MSTITVGYRPPFVERIRPRRWVCAVLALLTTASLLVVGASPAPARINEPDHLPVFSACVGPATETVGFVDTDGLSPEANKAINCLAHYRISRGKTRLTFAPDDFVTRQQMALFLSRAARPAGIVLPAATDQGFEDIEGLSEEVQNAINRVTKLKIMTGASADGFNPQGPVLRRDIVLFLARFLGLADLGEGGTDIASVTSDDRLFEDLSNRATREVEEAVYQLFELGVTKGTSDTAFSPDAKVTRGQMASFITRALAHTNARPSGITVQADSNEVVEGERVDVLISLRDRFHRPIVDVLVDLFSVDLAVQDPFERDGTCSASTRSQPDLLGSRACAIDTADLQTDGYGNVIDSIQVESGLTLWAWTGDIGDEYDEDEKSQVGEVGTFVVRTSKPPVGLVITDDVKEGATLLAFGDRITFMMQVVDRDRNPVAVLKTPRVEWTIEVNGVVKESVSKNYQTDSSGHLEFTFREVDPNLNDDDDVVILDFEVSLPELIVQDETTLGNELAARGEFIVTWSQEDSAATTLRIVQEPLFHVASDTGRGQPKPSGGGADRPVRRSSTRQEDTIHLRGRVRYRKSRGRLSPHYQFSRESHPWVFA